MLVRSAPHTACCGAKADSGDTREAVQVPYVSSKKMGLAPYAFGAL